LRALTRVQAYWLSLWPSLTYALRRRPRGVSLHEATQQLLAEAEVAAERRAGLVRILIAVLLLVAVFIAEQDLPQGTSDAVILRQIASAKVTLTLFGLVGAISYWLASRRLATGLLPVVTATADAILILGNLAYNLIASGIAGGFFASFPVIWVVPIAIAASAIHYRPRLQAYVAALYVGGISVIALSAGGVEIGQRRAALAELSLQFGPPPNVIRLLMLLAMAGILILVARQGRTLLERAVRETTLRTNLTRYLPRELAPILSEEALAGLRSGQRLKSTLLFVDIRGSSGLAEAMDPGRLAVFISSFRRRVMRAAERHGGVVDKFIGDGALLLFGVPAETRRDAANALACGRTLFRLVERWNEKRGFDPPVQIGVGVHHGEVFCGVVGTDERLEFTVLGEPVNIAARIEQATKHVGADFLASREAVEAAGELDGWEEISREPLRGVSREIVLMRPRAESRSSGS
jgi:adenylate cyclase